jgi:hypothetical protein
MTTADTHDRNPTATALLHAVALEMHHLACAAHDGTLDMVESLAIPHGPLLANLDMLRRNLYGEDTLASVPDSLRPIAVFIPLGIHNSDTSAQLP